MDFCWLYTPAADTRYTHDDRLNYVIHHTKSSLNLLPSDRLLYFLDFLQLAPHTEAGNGSPWGWCAKYQASDATSGFGRRFRCCGCRHLSPPSDEDCSVGRGKTSPRHLVVTSILGLPSRRLWIGSPPRARKMLRVDHVFPTGYCCHVAFIVSYRTHHVCTPHDMCPKGIYDGRPLM